MLGRIANCLIFKFQSERGCVLRNRDQSLAGSEVVKSPADKATNRQEGCRGHKAPPHSPRVKLWCGSSRSLSSRDVEDSRRAGAATLSNAARVSSSRTAS